MDVGPLSKRLKVVESGSKKNAIQQNPKFIDESAYVVQLFHALGYDEVSKTVIDTICNLIKEWLSLITTPLTIKGKYYLPYTYLHQLYPSYWVIYCRYYNDRKHSLKLGTDESEESDSQLSEYSEWEDDPRSKLNSRSIDESLQKDVDRILQIHYTYVNKRSLLMERDFYTASRTCLCAISASSSFITASFDQKPSHILCQFANLILYYGIVSLISLCTHLYHVNEDELTITIEQWRKQFWPNLDMSFNVKDSIITAIRMQSPKGHKKVKSMNKESIATQEYDFLQSMMYEFLLKQTDHFVRDGPS